MGRIWIALGCMLAGLGVAAGAFGAHALEHTMLPDLRVVYETAARYQLIHALALLFVGLAAGQWPDRRWDVAGVLFTAGIVVFAGSLYALALTGSRWLGAITPIGGGCFLAGWLAAALAARRAIPHPDPTEIRGGAE